MDLYGLRVNDELSVWFTTVIPGLETQENQEFEASLAYTGSLKLYGIPCLSQKRKERKKGRN